MENSNKMTLVSTPSILDESKTMYTSMFEEHWNERRGNMKIEQGNILITHV